MKLDDLYNVKGRKFTDKEKAFLRKKLPKSKWKIKYCIWKQERRNNRYILFLIDHFPGKIRPPAMDKAIEVIVTREISDLEYEEQIENFGCCKRVYECWDYLDIEYLIHEDQKYGVKTPQVFINECRKRGYTKQPDLFGGNYDYLNEI
jgi:hypothetical protein